MRPQSLQRPTRFQHFGEVLRAHAARMPDAPACVFLPRGEAEEVPVSYAELDRRARAIAARLRGVAPVGARALLLYPSGLEFVQAFFGCLYAGVIAVPAYPPRRGRGADRLESIIRDAGATVILTTEALLPDVEETLAPGLAPESHLLATCGIDSAGGDGWAPHVAAPDDLVFLQYTSGSTGMAKGVMVSHGNLLYNADSIRTAWGLDETSRSVCWMPLFHDGGLVDGLLMPIYTGFPAYFMPPEAFLQRPLRWLKTISRLRATHGGGPNFGFDLCVKRATPEALAELDLSSWRTAYDGAEPVRADTLSRFAEVFSTCGFRPSALKAAYGLAEATLMVAVTELEAPPLVVHVDREALQADRFEPVAGGPAAARLVGNGRAWLETTVRIVHPETLAPCEAGEIGEIWVGGPTIAQGYWRRPEQTAATFGARLADGDGPYMRTGDLGAIHAGELFITGRLKDLVILRGRNHYPHDLERTAELAHPRARLGCSAAFSVDRDGEDRLIVVLEVDVRAPGDAKGDAATPFEAAEVVSAVRRAIAEVHELQVHEVVLLATGTVPKTSSGKIQRRASREDYTAGRLDVVGRG